MAVPHFFVDRVDVGDVRLSPEDTRHAVRSLRTRPGEALTVADGAGTLGEGSLRGEEDGLAVVRIVSTRRIVRRAPLLSVAVAPPKGDRLAWCVQKLTELGVDEIVLLAAERSVRAWTEDRLDRTTDRLRAVAREAAMQSRRAFLPEVVAGRSTEEALGAPAPTVMLSGAGPRRLSEVLPEEPTAVRILIGPEGGFSPAEERAATAANASLASLGEPTLRTETAALAAAALVLARYGRLG